MRSKLLALAAAPLLGASAASAGLVVHYTFDDDSLANSGSGPDGTALGATSYGDSFSPGRAWQGDRATGNSAAIQTGLSGTDLGMGEGGVYTAMAWVNWAGGSGNVDHMVFGQDDGNTGGDAPQLHHGIRDDSAPNNIHFGGWGGAQDISDAGAVVSGTWTHVAWQYDGTNKNVYVDGSLVTSEAGSNITDPALNVLVGGHTRGNTVDNPYQSFNGMLDDVRIYDEVLTTQQIADVRTSTIPEPSTFGLLGLAAFGLLRRRR